MMMVATATETCTSDFGFSRIRQDGGEVHKVSLTEEDLLKDTQKAASATKHVTFAPTNRVLGTVPNRLDCSLEEINNRWFRKDEYSNLIWESSVTLTMLKCDKKKAMVDDNLLCARGLLDTESLVKRQEERSCINKLVLLELKETQDVQAAAQLYHDISQTVCQRSIDQAILDEEYAQRYANEAGSELNYGRGQHSQADNRTEIEQMILRELEKLENLDETDQKLMRGLKRLNKRKEREAEKARQYQEMMLMQRLQELANLYADPSLTPEERAAVEQAANELIQQNTSADDDDNNEQTVQSNYSSSPSDDEQDRIQRDDDDHDDDENPQKRQRIAR